MWATRFRKMESRPVFDAGRLFIVYRKYVVRKEFQTEFAYATALISRIIVSVETIRAP